MPTSSEFRTPPNWPPTPKNWKPPSGWLPDPSWGPAPPGWNFWGTPDKKVVSTNVEGQHLTHRRGHRIWLILYWIVTVFSLSFLVIAIVGDGEEIPLASYIGVTLGSFATLTGALMATRLSKHGISNVSFDEATAGMRVISIGWLLLVAIMLYLAIVYTAKGMDRSGASLEIVAATGDLTPTLFGIGALFAVVGPGYTAYRSAMAKLPQKGTPSSDPEN